MGCRENISNYKIGGFDMPNWCENKVSISGPAEEMAKMKKQMQSENSDFDFNGVLPEPKEMNDIVSGGCNIDGEYVTVWRHSKDENGDTVNTIIPEEELKFLKDTYGATNLYDWHCNNWGTKWNSDEAFVSFEDEETFEVSFATAWSPPTPVLEELARQFPKLNIHIRYEEPGCAFWGEQEWEGGEETHLECGEMDYDEETEEYIYK
jgi:hypothetical protein